jgi:DoxX-like family
MARASLVAVWLWTAIVSALQADGLSRSLLSVTDAIPPALYGWVIWGGSGVDLLLGLWMALKPGRLAYGAALCMTLVMTAVGSWVEPALWLHPLGPISKNLPIMALLWLLIQDQTP